MKKYIAIFAGLVMMLSLGAASAQITGGGVNVQCVRWDTDGTCAQYSAGANIITGSGVTQGAGGTYQQPGAYQQQPMTPAYVQGQNTRRPGAQMADLMFFGNAVNQAGGIIRMLPAILLGIAVVVFFYFLIRYLIAGKNEPGKKKEELSRMMYSLIAIFVMVTLWGIIAFFGDIIGINPNVAVTAPAIPGSPLPR